MGLLNMTVRGICNFSAKLHYFVDLAQREPQRVVAVELPPMCGDSEVAGEAAETSWVKSGRQRSGSLAAAQSLKNSLRRPVSPPLRLIVTLLTNSCVCRSVTVTLSRSRQEARVLICPSRRLNIIPTGAQRHSDLLCGRCR